MSATTLRDFNQLYSEVSENISQALDDIAGLKIDHEDGQQQISRITETLQTIQNNFNDDLTYLEENTEWDKFTMAFFGETNAGKSTIIEALRILLKEESRQQLLEQNEHDLEKFEQELNERIEAMRTDLARVYAEHAAKVAQVRQEIKQLAATLSKRSTAESASASDPAARYTLQQLIIASAMAFMAGAGALALLTTLSGS